MSSGETLLAVPNVSEGRDRATIDAVGSAFVQAGLELLDVHSDWDHHRTVYTLAGQPGRLAAGLLAGSRAAVELIDISDGRGVHPHVGAVDVVPLVYLAPRARGAACAEALLMGDLIGEHLHVPVLLYGELADGRTRADLRRGGPRRLQERIRSGELHQDFGPAGLHATAGATLVGARPPLVAFNIELAWPATLEDATLIAAAIREGGSEGLPGVRAIGVALRGRAGQPTAQVAMNVERPEEVPLRDVVAAIASHARITRGELVGLAPRVAFEGFPDEIPMPDFDPGRHLIENALGL